MMDTCNAENLNFFNTTDFDSENFDVIEVVSSDSELGLLKRSGNKNLKIFLPLCLCIGKLDGMNVLKRNELEKYINLEGKKLFENGFDFKYEYDKFLEYANKASKIRIWSSHLNCDDYCLLLYLCYILKDKNITVIYSEELNWEATTLGCISEEELKILEQKEHSLKKWEQEYFSNEWLRLIRDDSELRFMVNGQVISCDIGYFDNDILQRLEKLGKVKIYTLVADLMANPIIPYVRYSDWIYVYLINRLISNKLIEKSFENNIMYVEVIKF